MALQNLLFTDMISGATPINPGAGGWDTQLNQFMADERGRQGYRLLSRLISLVVPISPGTPLITLPAGWRCMPMVVMVTFTGAPPSNTIDYTFKCGTTVWHGGTAQSEDNFQHLDDTDHGLLVYPRSTAGSIFVNVPQQIPFVDGDATAPGNLFQVEVNTSSVIALNFFTFGLAWQSAD